MTRNGTSGTGASLFRNPAASSMVCISGNILRFLGMCGARYGAFSLFENAFGPEIDLMVWL
jgi:hypothetical protein